MDPAIDARWFEVVRQILAGAHLWQPDDLAPAVDAAISPLGLHTRVWLVDYEQVALHPLPQPGEAMPDPIPVSGSLAGRVFGRVRSAEADDGDEHRWWVPIVDGTDRLGVLEFVGVPTPDPEFSRRCELVAGLVGHLLATITDRGELLERSRRTRPMSTAAELLWQLLPPLTASAERAVVTAVLQPCYEVGGDGFDYGFDGSTLHLAVLDAAGRGLEAGITCAVALSAVRAARRSGQDLCDQARAADAALTGQFSDSRFATAVLAELNLDTGRVRYLNAGHPAPLVLRGGRVARELSGGRRMPLGLDDPKVEVGEELLEPEDRLLLHTDGVTEARTPKGDRFGVTRLVDLAEQHAAAGLPAPETLRRLAHAVLEHQGGPPSDDATLMLVEWSAAAALNTVPQVAQEEN
ncbi:PP2C family protein-serine/threonine phosphatase [Actinoplanes sp. NPDC051411]|uniref:PP2C family protein-serine/threonine phosphatase n=1 Tax=Actinoplanes sp. NPDC051411 TaxID=3155522 RepID=UPI0034492247